MGQVKALMRSGDAYQEFWDGLEDFVYRKRIMSATCGADLSLAMVSLDQIGEPCNGSQESGTSLPEVDCGATYSGFQDHMPALLITPSEQLDSPGLSDPPKGIAERLLGESVSSRPLSPRVPKCPLSWSRVSWACVSVGRESACTFG
jgi:hypothetical protein